MGVGVVLVVKSVPAKALVSLMAARHSSNRSDPSREACPFSISKNRDGTGAWLLVEEVQQNKGVN